jgi:hypothetical protein
MELEDRIGAFGGKGFKHSENQNVAPLSPKSREKLLNQKQKENEIYS